MAVHSTRRIIREGVHQALVGDGTSPPWEPVAEVAFRFMVETNDFDPERPAQINRDGTEPAVFIIREVQGAQVPQGHLGRVPATGAGIFKYSIFVQFGGGAEVHDLLDEEIRTKLDTYTDSTGAFVAFATEAVVDSIRGVADGFMEIEYSVPATAIGDF